MAFFTGRTRDLPHARVMLVARGGLAGLARASGSPYTHAALLVGPWVYEAGLTQVSSRRLVEYPWPYDLFGVEGLDAWMTAQLSVWCRETLRGSCTRYREGAAALFSLAFMPHDGLRVLADRRLMRAAEYVTEGLAHVGLYPRVTADCARPDLLELDPMLYMIKRGVA